jgi:hypothetical protein
MNIRPTPETDAAINPLININRLFKTSQKLERERDEARFDLDFRRRLGDLQNKTIDDLTAQRDEAREQANHMREKWLAKGQCCEHLGAELHEAIKQRDRLAEALKEIYNVSSFDYDTMPEPALKKYREVVLEMADEALQSLTQNEP